MECHYEVDRVLIDRGWVVNPWCKFVVIGYHNETITKRYSTDKRRYQINNGTIVHEYFNDNVTLDQSLSIFKTRVETTLFRFLSDIVQIFTDILTKFKRRCDDMLPTFQQYFTEPLSLFYRHPKDILSNFYWHFVVNLFLQHLYSPFFCLFLSVPSSLQSASKAVV